MDEGTAALIAAIAGMVGALGGAAVGGIAAVRGARLGAEKSAEATRQQVKDQAVVEHLHWLRQERREACVELLTSSEELVSALWQIWELVEPLVDEAEPGQPIITPEMRTRLTTADEVHDACLAAKMRLFLLGPDDLLETAEQLVETMWSSAETLQALLEDEQRLWADENSFDEPVARLREAGRHYNRFVVKVREVLTNPSNSTP
ncbi:hypothetical protein [Streptomyces niveus]|uniref:hypothetical protein n=1 Tax=Streptomyces niveus TaxID=193462 RepID=UPI00342CD974